MISVLAKEKILEKSNDHLYSFLLIYSPDNNITQKHL